MKHPIQKMHIYTHIKYTNQLNQQTRVHSLHFRQGICNSIWVFTVLSPAQEFFTNIWRRPHYRWRVQNLDLCSALRAFEQAGIFTVPHLLWHGATVFPVSFEGSSHSVTVYDTWGGVEDLFWPGSSRVNIVFALNMLNNNVILHQW
jgi:hypothetical protein